MDGAAHAPKVALVLDQLALEPSLQQVTRTTVLLRKPIRRARCKILHASREVRLRSAEEQRNVIGHEHEAEEIPAEPADSLGQSVDEPLMVGVVMKDALAGISPAHDMRDSARILDSQWPGHPLILTGPEREVNRLPDLTPRTPHGQRLVEWMPHGTDLQRRGGASMPRTARASEAGFTDHVLNRGNAGSEVFHEVADYAAFLQVIHEASLRLPMPLLAYCRMPNHFHLVVRPLADGDLSRWMPWLLTTHVRRDLKHYGHTGHV